MSAIAILNNEILIDTKVYESDKTTVLPNDYLKVIPISKGAYMVGLGSVRDMFAIGALLNDIPGSIDYFRNNCNIINAKLYLVDSFSIKEIIINKGESSIAYHDIYSHTMMQRNVHRINEFPSIRSIPNNTTYDELKGFATFDLILGLKDNLIYSNSDFSNWDELIERMFPDGYVSIPYPTGTSVHYNKIYYRYKTNTLRTLDRTFIEMLLDNLDKGVCPFTEL